MVENDYSVYTDLDTLFDTYLPTLCSVAPNDIEVLIDKGYNGLPYNKRISNKTDIIDNDIVTTAWNRRTKNTLVASMPTKILSFITLLLTEHSQSGNKAGDPMDGDLLINTWPYDLTDDEEGLLISDLLSVSNLPKETSIHTINLSPFQISQDYIKRNKIKILISTHGMDMLASLIENFSLVNNRLMNTTLCCPALAEGSDFTPSNFINNVHYEMNPFTFIETSVREWIELKFLDVDLFCGKV